MHVHDIPSSENLRCFLAAARHLSFRRAADEVALTPAAFGQRIRQMEERMGHPLFTRTTRSVRLTRAGMSLVPVAEDALVHARRCLEVVRSGQEPPVHLMLGTRFELGMSWLLPALLDLERDRPTWQVETDFGSGKDILSRLERGEVDAIVTSAPVARASWTADYLHPETYRFVASPRLLERLPLSAPADAHEHTLLDINDTLPLARYLLDGGGAPLRFGSVRACGAGAAILELLKAERGVAVMPEYMVEDALESGELVELLPDLERLSDSFRLIYRRDHPLKDALADLAGVLRATPLTHQL